MEDTLGEKKVRVEETEKPSLNPCFNGRYSRSNYEIYYKITR